MPAAPAWQLQALVSKAAGAVAAHPSRNREDPAAAWRGARGGLGAEPAATPRGAHGARPTPASTEASHVPGAAPSGRAGATRLNGELGAPAICQQSFDQPYHNIVGTQSRSAC
jgi:hypothetical protein